MPLAAEPDIRGQGRSRPLIACASRNTG